VTLDGEDRRCGDEYVNRFIASFTKGLPHNEYGEVDPDAYCALLRAMASGEPDDFEQVPLGCTLPQCRPPECPPECARPSRMLEGPQSAFAFDLEGADSHALLMKPAPRFDSEEVVAEIAENYWMVLARDVPFTEYDTDPLIKEAADDLSKYACFRGPTNQSLLFRGVYPGEQEGPYVSQFLYRDTPYGAQFIPAMIRTVLPEVDYMTSYGDWLEVQNGCDRDQMFCDPVPRFIRNGRDLGQYVHVDLTFNAFLNAGLILMSGCDPLRRCEARPGMGVEYARCLPYVNPMAPRPEQFPASRGRKSASPSSARRTSRASCLRRCSARSRPSGSRSGRCIGGCGRRSSPGASTTTSSTAARTRSRPATSRSCRASCCRASSATTRCRTATGGSPRRDSRCPPGRRPTAARTFCRWRSRKAPPSTRLTARGTRPWPGHWRRYSRRSSPASS
jgi:hypothetical protein